MDLLPAGQGGHRRYVTPFELPEPDTGDGEMGGAADVDMQHLDPLFEEAARSVIISQQGSTSMIQRRFSIGYNRAGRLMDQLEKAGIVGAAHGGKPRDVLIAEEVAKKMTNDHIDVFVSSDLHRSIQTCEIIAKPHHQAVVTTPLIRERDWGSFTCKFIPSLPKDPKD